MRTWGHFYQWTTFGERALFPAGVNWYPAVMSPIPPIVRRPDRRLKWTLHSLVYLLLLYVFAAGPLYWKIYEAYQMEGSPLLRVLYYPLLLACEHSDYVSNFLHWYVDLWVF